MVKKRKHTRFLNLRTEGQYWQNGLLVAGCDEVGRGSLAGPMVAAGVVLPRGFVVPPELAEVRDSKLLTPAKREKLSLLIKKYAKFYSVAGISPVQIDQLGVHEANMQILGRVIRAAIFTLGYKLHTLVDGRFTVKEYEESQTAVVDGDAKIFSIAAASIVAKVYRDQYMIRLDDKFPGFGFAQHKGYGTRLHFEKLKKFGPSLVHRRSFLH